MSDVVCSENLLKIDYSDSRARNERFRLRITKTNCDVRVFRPKYLPHMLMMMTCLQPSTLGVASIPLISGSIRFGL